jgi:hypothetical protein
MKKLIIVLLFITVLTGLAYAQLSKDNEVKDITDTKPIELKWAIQSITGNEAILYDVWLEGDNVCLYPKHEYKMYTGVNLTVCNNVFNVELEKEEVKCTDTIIEYGDIPYYKKVNNELVEFRNIKSNAPSNNRPILNAEISKLSMCAPPLLVRKSMPLYAPWMCILEIFNLGALTVFKLITGGY